MRLVLHDTYLRGRGVLTHYIQTLYPKRPWWTHSSGSINTSTSGLGFQNKSTRALFQQKVLSALPILLKFRWYTVRFRVQNISVMLKCLVPDFRSQQTLTKTPVNGLINKYPFLLVWNIYDVYSPSKFSRFLYFKESITLNNLSFDAFVLSFFLRPSLGESLPVSE